MSANSGYFAAQHLDRIRAETFVEQVAFHQELPSTNDLALELIKSDELHSPLLVLAELQTAGRGRGANRWWSDKGALTFSLVIETTAAQLPRKRWPKISLTAGLAVCEVLSELVPEALIGLKWPNDVCLARRKVCGILVEVPPQRRDCLILGVGINVNNSLVRAPARLQKVATSLADVTDRHYDLCDLLVRILKRVSLELTLLADGDRDLSKRWQTRCLLCGRVVHHSAGSRTTTGVCEGIDPDGALILRTESGRQRFFGGTLTEAD